MEGQTQDVLARVDAWTTDEDRERNLRIMRALNAMNARGLKRGSVDHTEDVAVYRASVSSC